MKANAFVRIIIWSLVIVILAGILVAGLFRDVMSDKEELRRQQANVDANSPQNFVSVGNAVRFPANTIREISIEWVVGNIVILPADVQEITVSESGITNSKYAMVCSQNGEKLKIQYSREKSVSFIGIHSTDYISKDLCIQVPMDWECDALETDSAFATLEVQNMTIREVDFDGTDGTCSFVNCNIAELDIDTASGDVAFSGTLKTLDFDAASAGFTGAFQNTPNQIDMDSMSGSLDIALPEDCGFSLSMDGISNSFHSDFQGITTRNGTHVYADGRCQIQVNGVSSNVTIRKLDTTIE